MGNVVMLNEAFDNFTRASKSLETYYTKLRQRVDHLTNELEEKNRQLNEAIAEVRESKDYLQAILQSIGEAIIVLDQDEKISVMNKAAEDLLCIDPTAAIGRQMDDLTYNIDRDSSGTKLTVKDKKLDIMFSRSKVLDSDGRISGFVILIKDITKLKELERHQERNQRLIAMGEMAAKIVHEIRSPLCSIELFSNMLSKDLEGSCHSEMACGISTGIKSLNNILTNMLFFAKQQKPVMRDINLNEIVEDSITMLFPLMQTRGVKLSRSLNDEVIEGDAELLKQVFMNVILNAIQAMPEGGNLRLHMDRSVDFISIEIVDQGAGIEPEYVEKIFDPFFSTKEKGTGLGLATSHRIMQCHKGFIRVYGNESKGTTFCLYFPKKGCTGNTEDKQHLHVCSGRYYE